jgi:TPR repeat protein
MAVVSRFLLSVACVLALATGAIAQAPTRTFAWDTTLAAAQKGDAEAQFIIGMAYYRGVGAPADEREALSWITRAAAGRNPDAQYHLGLAYLRGTGVAQDEATAAMLFGDAAAQGHAEAQYILATLLTNGRGVPQDHVWAALWYSKAARQGLAQAQSVLGLMYLAGLGVPVDHMTALQWLSIAARFGDAPARAALASLSGTLNENERAALARTAAAWTRSADGGATDRAATQFLQQNLARLGYDPGPADGLMGARTQTALEEFRARVGEDKGPVTFETLQAVRMVVHATVNGGAR